MPKESWTHQPVKISCPIPPALDQECRLPAKLRLTERQAAQLDWISLELAHHAARFLDVARFHPRDRSRPFRREEDKRRCAGIQHQVRRKMIHFCGDDGEFTPQLQRKGVLQRGHGSKQDSVRRVVNFKWVFTHHVQADHTIDANRDGLGQEGQIFDHHAEIVSSDRAKLQVWHGRQSGLHSSVDTCQDA